jgi:hypothetical protein
MKTYKIEYGIYIKGDKYESHTTKVKNCMSDLNAKIKLEEWLKKKYDNFDRLVVYKCNEDTLGGIFDFMGKDNPFNF